MYTSNNNIHEVNFKYKPWYFQHLYYRALKAISEIRGLWDYEVNAYTEIYSNTYHLLSFPMSDAVIQYCCAHKEDFAIFDTYVELWLLKPKYMVDYEYCHNGKCFIKFIEAKTKKHSRLLLVGKYTVLMQQPNLFRATNNAFNSYPEFKIPIIDMIQGVPGCGKTTYIINHHKKGDLVLTTGREAAANIRERIATLEKYTNKEIKELYRTIDSYFLNSQKRYSEVWIDEALMKHPGEIFLVCLYSKCNILHLLGDINQISYINRTDMELKYNIHSDFFKPSQFLRVSYRCPKDVMNTLSSKYPGGAFSNSNVCYSMTWKTYSCLSDVPNYYNKNTKYLVFKQNEKKIMQSAGYDVSTIHEYQGKQAKHIIIVRMSRNVKEGLYNSPEHVLVGMTRHTETLIYYTPVTDSLKKIICDSEEKIINPIQSKIMTTILSIPIVWNFFEYFSLNSYYEIKIVIICYIFYKIVIYLKLFCRTKHIY